MRRGGQAVAISVAVHGAVVGGIAAWAASRPEEPPPVLEEATPVEVALVGPEVTTDPVTAALVLAIGADSTVDTAGAAAHTEVDRGGIAHARGTQAFASSGSHGTETGTGSGSGSTGKNLFRMRGPELKPTAINSFDPNAHPAPPPVQISGRLQDAGRGSVINDRVTTVTVERDGTAHFHDKPDGEVHVIIPIVTREQLGNMLRTWYADPYAQTRAGKPQEVAPVDKAVEGGWNSGLTPMPGSTDQSGKPDGGASIPILGGSFDVTAWAMRKAHVGDPYQARKRALLDATRAERVEKGGAYRAEQLSKSAVIMQGNLDQLWRTVKDPAERRASLFALWDEAAEGEGPQGEAGQRARLQVIGFIRGKLPKGSADAFTADELKALDAKRSSSAHFCPYE